MKVLFITYPMAFHTPGGGEIQLLAYKKALEEKGVVVDLFNPWNPNFKEYDIVHYFSVIGGSVHICNFIKQLRIPLVITSSLWITEETKYLYPIEEIYHQLSLADIIIGNSDVECMNMSSIFNLPRNQFKTVYNGVEKIFFDKINGKLFRDKFNINNDFILNVGNIEPRKNQLNLVKAMKNFKDKKLILIGHIRDEQYAEQVFKLGGEQIVYIGALDNKEKLLRSAFSACEVFCLPSTLETPGLAALEAYVSGAKVAITSVGATKEYFCDDVEYLDPSSVESIINAIYATINTNFIKKNNYISNNILSWEDSVNNLLEIYNDLKK